jgi:hypothetical protein
MNTHDREQFLKQFLGKYDSLKKFVYDPKYTGICVRCCDIVVNGIYVCLDLFYDSDSFEYHDEQLFIRIKCMYEIFLRWDNTIDTFNSICLGYNGLQRLEEVVYTILGNKEYIKYKYNLL